MPAFGVVDALQGDTIDMAQTAAYYFTGKDPIFAFSCAVPFGLTALQMNGWKDHGNGRKLLDAFFAKYNFKTASAGNTTTQMGGWYRKEIKTVEDLKGLKMRLGGGVFGEAMAKLGVVAQNMPAGDVYQALEKGTLDAVEFVGPYDDEKLGFNKVAPYYYYPGWWEGSAELEFFINIKKYNALSPENKAILDAATRVAAADMTSKYQVLNPQAIKRLVANKTQLKMFPKPLMDAGFKASMEVFAEHEAKSPEFKKIHQDMRAFQRDQILWNRFSEYPSISTWRLPRSDSVRLKTAGAMRWLQKTAACCGFFMRPKSCEPELSGSCIGQRKQQILQGFDRCRAKIYGRFHSSCQDLRVRHEVNDLLQPRCIRLVFIIPIKPIVEPVDERIGGLLFCQTLHFQRQPVPDKGLQLHCGITDAEMNGFEIEPRL
jgi:TRAP-type mannitol/chloroaromatic compound transport system substrate-binding protein